MKFLVTEMVDQNYAGTTDRVRGEIKKEKG